MTIRLYLAGPMSGLPEFNYPAFHEAANQLRTAGYQVTNPADNHDLTQTLPPYETMLAQALKQSIDCTAVAVLPGWEQSRGATIEVAVARALRRIILPVEDWLNHPPKGPAT